MLRRLLHVLLFLVGLAGTSGVILSIDPMPFWSWTRNKLGYLDKEIDRYDTLFFGSSRMHYALMPKVFDRRMAELGVPTRSYNVALSGQRPYDFDEILQWLLARRPKQVKRVVIELCCWELDYREGDWMATQELEMRTARSFLPRFRTILDGRAGWQEKVSLSYHHVVHTLVNVLRIGQGGRMLDDLLARARGAGYPMVYPPVDEGYYCIDETSLEHWQLVHKKFVAEPTQPLEAIAGKVQDVAPSWLAGTFRSDILRAEAAALEAAGIETVFVVLPEISWGFFGRAQVASIRGDLRVMELDHPEEERPMFDLDLWWDSSHLCRKGAERFSSYFAERLCEFESLPPGASLKPRVAADLPPVLTAQWLEAAPTLSFAATGLPFVGKVEVQVGAEAVDAPAGDAAALRIEQPPLATVELGRTGLATAAGTMDAAALQKQVPLFAQLVASIDGKAVAVSVPVRVEPR